MNYLSEPLYSEAFFKEMGLHLLCVFIDDSTEYEAYDNITQGKIQIAAKLTSCRYLCLL